MLTHVSCAGCTGLRYKQSLDELADDALRSVSDGVRALRGFVLQSRLAALTPSCVFPRGFECLAPTPHSCMFPRGFHCLAPTPQLGPTPRERRIVPDHLCCSITMELMKDPVVTPSGHRCAAAAGAPLPRAPPFQRATRQLRAASALRPPRAAAGGPADSGAALTRASELQYRAPHSYRAFLG